jgi:hypothetical protein
VGLEPGNSLYTAQKAQSYKLAKLPDRIPGAQEKFFIRYIGKDEDGNKIIGNLSPALVFTNTGIETFKYVNHKFGQTGVCVIV